jgi:hypothetical protein
MSIDKQFFSYNEDLRMKLINKVVDAYIDQINKLEKPGIFSGWFSNSNSKEK